MPSIVKQEPIPLLAATAIFDPGGKSLPFRWFAIATILFLAEAYDTVDPLSGEINHVKFPKVVPF